MARRSVGREYATVAALLLASGCDLTYPWSSGEVVDGPGDVVASEDPLDFDVVRLSWTPRLGDDRFEVQLRAGSGDWQDLGVGAPVALDTSAIAVRIDPLLPERTALAFRVRAAGGASRWSNEAPFLRGIRPPTSFSAEVATTEATRSGPVHLTWTSASQVATAVQLERSPLDGAQNPILWEPLAGASLGAGRYVDPCLRDGVAYAYRVRVGADGLWSVPREARTSAVQLAAPCGIRAVVEPGGVRVTWTNRSTTAESLSIGRYTREFPSSDGVGATLPPTQESWLDAAVPVWPATGYQVTAARWSAYLVARSEIVPVEPFPIAGPPALFASARRLPEGEWVARDAAGRFHLAQGIYASPRIHRATASGHETYVLPGAFRIAAPGVILDARGAPHTVFLAGEPFSTQAEIVHAWWDGAAWQSETVPTGDVGSGHSGAPQAWFGLDAAGGVQVLHWQENPAGGQASLVHLARDGDGWTSTTVTTPSVPDFFRWGAAFAVAPDGSTYVAQLGSTFAQPAPVAVLCTRTPAGAWSDEIVPAGPFNSEGPWLAPGDGGDLALLHTNGSSVVEVVLLRRSGGTWSAPEIVATREPQGSSLELAVAPASVARRLALLTSSSGSAELHVREESGWSAARIGPSGVLRAWLGFGPSGSAWALIPHDSAIRGPTMSYSLFDEVR